MRKASEIQSRDVQIGDLIEILWTIDSENWCQEARDQIGQQDVVQKLNANSLPVELGGTRFSWSDEEFKIIKTKEELEEDSKSPIPVDTSKRHVHYEVIKSWIEDTTQIIQLREDDGIEWRDIYTYPGFHPEYQYRIKPKKQKVKVWQFLIRDKHDGKHLLSTMKYRSLEDITKAADGAYEILYKIPESEEEIEVDTE